MPRKKPDGWVFTRPGSTREIGFARPNEYKQADDAANDFAHGTGVDCEVYYRKDGKLHSCDAESRPEDF